MAINKIDIINGAFSAMRISGLTVTPDDSDQTLALDRLENLAAELAARNICLGYNFEETPNINSSSNIGRAEKYALECILAVRLLSDYGKGQTPDPILLNNANAQSSYLHTIKNRTDEIQYPRRQPVGAGNRLRTNVPEQFFQPVAISPNECATNRMNIGNINDFVEHFDAYLIDDEVISSYTIEAETGLTIVSSSNTDTDVNYRISAVGNSSSSDLLLRVKIVVTTDNSRVETRFINFELTDITLSS